MTELPWFVVVELPGGDHVHVETTAPTAAAAADKVREHLIVFGSYSCLHGGKVGAASPARPPEIA